jgi:dolichol kinase
VSLTAPREDWRRLVHLATGAAAFATTLVPDRATSLILGLLLGVAVVAELARRRSAAVRDIIEWAGGSMLRPAERKRVTGPTLLVAGYALAWFLFPAAVAMPAMVVAAVADPAAALVGRRLGRRPGRKSLAGSVAAYLAAAGALIALAVPLTAAAAAGVVAALAERAPEVDNVAVPVATATALQVLL